MWFDPHALLARKPPPAVSAVSAAPAVLAFGLPLKTAEPQKPQPSNTGELPAQTAESQKPQAPPPEPASDPAPHPDLWCWPHSSAMNTQEIATFIVRLEQFSHKGVSLAEAELLAERLVLRDRDEDDRQLCLECQHLQGDVGRWRCANAQRAGMAVGTANAPLPAGLTQQLQRCPGLKPTTTAINATTPF